MQVFTCKIIDGRKVLTEAVGEPDVKDQVEFQRRARKNPKKYSEEHFVPVTVGKPFRMTPETQYGMEFMDAAPAKPAEAKKK